MIEYVAYKLLGSYPSLEDPVSGGHFAVGRDYGTPASPLVLFPDEESALAAAIDYADELLEADHPNRYVVKRIQTETVWEGKGR